MSSHHGILIHVVFSTKYRKAVLADAWRDDLFAYIGGTVKVHKAVLSKAGGIEDHVHLLMKIHPQFAISSTIQSLTANSSRWINETNRTRIKFQWQSGYGAFSVSQSASESVKAYITNQRTHHQKLSFKDEYLAMLLKHQVTFDPKYVFEQEIVG